MQRRRVGGGALVMDRGQTGRPVSTRAVAKAQVVLTDVDMPFWRMVWVITKFMLASIPAAILFYLITIGIFILGVLAFGGLGSLMAASAG